MPNYPTDDEDLSDVDDGLTIVEPIVDINQEIQNNQPGEIELPPGALDTDF